MLQLILLISAVLTSIHGQLTCTVLTNISPYFLAYTPVDFNGAISVCANFGASLAAYTSTMNTQYGLWTDICNFIYNSQVQTLSSGFNPPFWISSTSVSDVTTLCGILPYGPGEATSVEPNVTFLNCFLSFYPLCSGPFTTAVITGATAIATQTTIVLTVTASTSTTSTSTRETTQFFFSSTTSSQTVSSILTSTLITQSTVSITGLTTLTGSVTTTRTRTLLTTFTDSEVVQTTSSSTSTLTSTTSTTTTTTSTTLRTIFTCLQ